MRSLLNKLLVHDSSNAHKLCLTKLAEQKQNIIGRSMLNNVLTWKTKRVFQTAYYIAKHNPPFTDQELLVALQNENGTEMGTALQSRLSATNIIEHISASMKKKKCQSLIQNNWKIYLMLDKSTTISWFLLNYCLCSPTWPGGATVFNIEINHRLPIDILKYGSYWHQQWWCIQYDWSTVRCSFSHTHQV